MAMSRAEMIDEAKRQGILIGGSKWNAAVAENDAQTRAFTDAERARQVPAAPAPYIQPNALRKTTMLPPPTINDNAATAPVM